MAISTIGAAAASTLQNKYTLPLTAATAKVIEAPFTPGLYTFTFSSTTKLSIGFYNSSGGAVQTQNNTTSYTSLSFAMASAFSKIFIMTESSVTMTLDIVQTAPLKSSFTSRVITSTQSVTLDGPSTVVVIGGGGGSNTSAWGGAGSGYLATGTLAAGTYTATVGAGGNGAIGSASSISTISANGGNPNNGQVGGAGGSGGGGGGGGAGGSNGGNGGSGGFGGGGAGSGVTLGFPLTPGTGGPSGASYGGQGGGTYAGGAGGGSNVGNGTNGTGYGGGGGGNVNSSPTTGSAGVVFILTNL